MRLINEFKIFLLLSLSLLLVIQLFAQQSILDKKISVSFTDVPVGTALRKIQTQAGVKFSYNPDLIPSSKRTSLKCVNQPLGEVLKQLVNDPGLSFREIGNQIVVYRGDQAAANPETYKVPVPEKQTEKKIPDTVYVQRTDTVVVFKTDTIYKTINTVRVDTLKLTDTIYRNKVQKPGKRLKNVFNNSVKQQKFLQNNGLYAGLYFEMLPGNLNYSSASSESVQYTELMKNANSSRPGKFSAGILGGYDYLKVGVRSGIGYTRLGENFEYAFSTESGGFYKTDTVERYYSLSGIDTTWFYITDSSWIPKETQDFKFKNPNSYHYIYIPLAIKFRLWQNDNAEVYALGGVSARFLISTSALHIDPENVQNTIWTSSHDLAPVVFSWHAGLGGAVKMGEYAGVLGELTYYGQINNQYQDLPLDKTYGLVGVKIGVYLKL